MIKILKNLSIGPATLVSAAFIGPGTIITCSLAGAGFGTALIWALVLGILTTIVLQEMSSRLTIFRSKSLAEVLNEEFKSPLTRFIIFLIVISAIGIGNSAYQSGNIAGASLGIELLLVKAGIGFTLQQAIWIVGGCVFLLLFFGRYQLLEKILVTLVIIMSLVFVSTVFLIDVEWMEVLKSVVLFSIPNNSFYLILGLIGTTVVPYNLFLHSSAVRSRGWEKKDVNRSRLDILISIGLGGVISICIVITSAIGLYERTDRSPENLDVLATQLSPLLGDYASILLALGILSAGLTSSITAPLAASYTVCGLLKKKMEFSGTTFRITWIIVLLSGLIVSSSGLKPLMIIQYAQFMNGLMLPFIAILLLYLINSPKMGSFKNSLNQNIIAIIFISIVVLLGIRSLVSIFS